MTQQRIRWRGWMLALVLLLVLTAVGSRFYPRSRSLPVAGPPPIGESSPVEVASSTNDPVAVNVIHPRKGAMEHVTVQPGSLQGYESVQLFAKVSGYLKTQSVDIGDRVKRGQVLAVVDVPELQKQLEKNTATLERSRARVEQMRARIATAKAEQEVARAQVIQAEATAKSAAASHRFREKQLSRMRELYSTKSIDERLVDESMERYEAALEQHNSAKASISTAHAQVASATAKIQGAHADLIEAEAEIKVAQADLDKSQVQLDFANLIAPFDGVVTQRGLFPGDFVRSATEGGGAVPLLTIQRTDRMRVVVQVPDREVPYTDPGDAATVEIDALPGQKFPAKVSRIAAAEDPQTRLMHVEIDLPNTGGKLRQGMYGRVTILLEKASKYLSVPSACLVGKTAAGKGAVYVMRDGHAQLTKVQLGTDNGNRVEVLQGLKGDDEVVLAPGTQVSDGTEVVASPFDEQIAPSK